MPIDQLLGPGGLAVAASVAVIALWRDRQRSDALKDRTIEALTATVGQFPAALKDLTAVVMDSVDRERRRSSDER